MVFLCPNRQLLIFFANGNINLSDQFRHGHLTIIFMALIGILVFKIEIYKIFSFVIVLDLFLKETSAFAIIRKVCLSLIGTIFRKAMSEWHY